MAALAELEAQLVQVTNLSAVLNGFRSCGYSALGPADLVRVKRAIRLRVDAAMDDDAFKMSFQNYLNVPLNSLQVPLGMLLEVPANLVFSEVLLGENGIWTETLAARGWHDTSMTLMEPEPIHARFVDPESSVVTTFKNNARLIANVLFLLNVNGSRFIRDETLMDLVRRRSPNGQLTKMTRDLMEHMHEIPVQDLWASHMKCNEVMPNNMSHMSLV